MQSITEFIEKGKEEKLTHLVVSERSNNRNQNELFLNQLFLNEEKFPYLKKMFDSKEIGYDYHMKIFKINYELFDEYLK